MAGTKQKLPIDDLIPQALRALQQQSALILHASPGTGKTTRLPPALLQALEGEIVVLEPRRLAAKFAARRVSEELGVKLGELVGYQFRFENVSGPKTRLKFFTEGMLLRRMLSDPELKRVSAVVLDEFHERHLHTDLALGYLRHLQLTRRPDLKLIVMSATLDSEALARYLGDAAVLRIEARLFPVDIRYLPAPPAKHLETLVREAVVAALDAQPRGDTLVFLPGMREIQRASEALAPLVDKRGIRVFPLHGELTRDEQDEALGPSPQRKVILSTNVAETSLTIEGVNAVIDSGLHRQASYSQGSGVPNLRTRSISRASAIQRAGRAGRTEAGLCLRLYTRGDFDGRPPFEKPELHRADLTQALLELKSLGVEDLRAFPWFERPPENSFESAEKLLVLLGAVDGAAAGAPLTPIGRRMSSIPTHPRLARILTEAEKLGVLSEAAQLCALISEGALEELDAQAALRSSLTTDSVRRARTQLLAAFDPPTRDHSTTRDPSPAKALGFAVLCGFPDRVAQKKPTAARTLMTELLFATGGSIEVEDSGIIAESEFFVALEMRETQGSRDLKSRLRLQSVLPIDADWLLDLEPGLLREEELATWDEDRKRVSEVSRLAYGELVLSESRKSEAPGSSATSAETRRLLARMSLGIDLQAPPELAVALEKLALEPLWARVDWLQRYQPDFPKLSLADLIGLVERALAQKQSLAQVREIDWNQELLLALEERLPGATHKLDQGMPLALELPGGRRPRIQYSLAQAPWLESRLQDFFGMKRGPSLANGKLPLILHLLAPNQRAVQITSDLASFWQKTYPEVRKELSRRYPRHSWPDDPLTASPPPPRPPRPPRN